MLSLPIHNPKSRVPSGCRYRRLGINVAVLCTLAVAALLGCKPKAAVTNSQQSQQAQLRQADQSDALLKAAANQLNDLPSAVDTEMHPPEPILDAEKHPKHEDVYAVCVANTTAPGNPINVLQVPCKTAFSRPCGSNRATC